MTDRRTGREGHGRGGDVTPTWLKNASDDELKERRQQLINQNEGMARARGGEGVEDVRPMVAVQRAAAKIEREMARRRTASRGERQVSEMSIDDIRDELQGIPRNPRSIRSMPRTRSAADKRRAKIREWTQMHGKRYDDLHDELQRKLSASRAERERARGERLAAVRAKLRSGKPLSEMRGSELDAYLDGLLELKRALQQGPDTDATRAEHQNVGAAVDRVRSEIENRR